MKLTILIPCLDENESIAFAVNEAMGYIHKTNIDGEVLVSDNGSRDGSPDIARAHGARVVHCPRRGYGAAVRLGIHEAQGEYIIMADGDGSYNLSDLDKFVQSLSEADMVIGNRYRGKIEKGACRFWHRWLGVPALSFLGRIASGVKIRDFHCGIRGFRKEAIERLTFAEDGMAFASEMILKAAKEGLRLGEVPADLRRDKRVKNNSHLKSVQDGISHILCILQNTNFKRRTKL